MLHTVTALLLTPDEFPGEIGDSFEAACAAVRIEPIRSGYGIVLAQDDVGGRWTQITTDAGSVSSARSIWNMGLHAGYEPPGSSVVAVWPGWPVGCSLGIPGLGQPHDPQGVGRDSVLRPPRGWTPARRRAMADTIAAELADMRGRTMQEHIDDCLDACNMGDTGPGPPPARLIDTRARIDPGHPAHEAVDRAIAQAWSLAATTKPPPGSIRTRTARPGKARIVRANGDGWTLAGRTDGPVVLLADALPGVPVDISDAPQLTGLLDALTAAARRTQG